MWLGVLAAVLLLPAPPRAHYASPLGSPNGDGSRANPWDLATALAGGRGRVQPGDTVWLRGGVYHGRFVSTLAGTAAQPIVVRQAPRERAVLDHRGAKDDAFVVQGSWTWYWGFELTNSDPVRRGPPTSSSFRPDVVVNDGEHNRYINLVVHDGGVAFYNYGTSPDVEVSGCILFDNGWVAIDRGHGHALYVKSDTGTVVLRDNVVFDQFGYGVHAYTDKGHGSLRNIRVEGNFLFDNGAAGGGGSANLLVGGAEPAAGIVVSDNVSYVSPGVESANVLLGFGSVRNADAVIRGNVAVGGSPVLRLRHWAAVTVLNNTWTGAGSAVVVEDADTGGGRWRGNRVSQAGSGSPGPLVVVRPNAYEPGRAFVAVYNPAALATVPVDLAGVLRRGERYEVRNVQALDGPAVATGTYVGVPVAIPTAPVPRPIPIGLTAPPAAPTGPVFNVFLVVRLLPRD
ncbi:MAG TPA: right-handed parallel beta-helix repeat-containing protein [Gemmatimonadales bacterium]